MAAQIIDISKKITNELPVVKITEDIVVTVNNRKSTVLNVMAFMDEMEKKGNSDDVSSMEKVLDMLIGKKNADAIEALDLPLSQYTLVVETVMNVATGDYGTPSK